MSEEPITLTLTPAEAEFLTTVLGDTKDRARRLVQNSPYRVTRHAKAYEVQMATSLLERLPSVDVVPTVPSAVPAVAVGEPAAPANVPPVTGPTGGPVAVDPAPVTPGNIPPAPWEPRENGFPARKTK